MPDLVANCIRVKDGDTVVVQGSEGNRAAVRLHGIDCPETGQPYGTGATEAAKKVAEGEVVEVNVVDTDHYGRIVGRVIADGTNLGASLAYSGYAWHDQRHAPGSSQIKEAEQAARKEGRGLWSQEEPTPPWEYRNGSTVDTGSAAKGLAWFLTGAAAAVVLTVLLSL